MVKDIDTGSDDSDPEFFTVMDNILYFIATTYSSNDELWRSDGTEEGTFMVKDIRNGSQGSYLSSLTIMGNNLYFQANDGVHGRELWKSDGTEAGTVIVKDIWSGSSSSDAGASITAIGDTIFFQARDGTGNGQELWKSDGTANGTVMVKDIRSGASSGNPGESTDSFTAIGNTIFFDADDGIHGYELWKSDGTANGTVMVKDIKSGGSSDHSYPGLMTAVGNKLFFRAVPTDEHELWVSDGTENGTIMLTDPAPYSSCCTGLKAIGDTLFFSYKDGSENGTEMWRSDGTAAGTVMANDLCTPYCST